MKIGIIQQHNTPDVVNNKKRLAAAIRSVAGNGAQLVVLQELHNSLYFCQEERVDLFDLAEPIPGPSTAFYGDLARELGVVIVTSLFERRAAGLYHNTAVVMERDGTIAGNTVKCIFQTIRHTMRNSILRQAIWAFIPLILLWVGWECWSVGTNGIQKQLV